MFLINTIFNETELAIFSRQTGFTFSECFRSTDGTLCALDPESDQIFIGKDLLTRNVHKLSSIVSVETEEDGCVCISFKDSSETRLVPEDAALLSVLKKYASPDGDLEETEEFDGGEEGKDEDIVENVGEDVEGEDNGGEVRGGDDRLLLEVYSRLINTGRGNAINYLVSEIGMSMEEAREYVDMLDGQDNVENPQKVSERLQTTNAHVPTDKDLILAIVKELKPGDKIHVEYKPLLGKAKVYEAEFVKLEINILSKYFSLCKSADTFDSFMDEIAFDLFDKIKIHFFCLENCSEHSVALGGVRDLKRL